MRLIEDKEYWISHTDNLFLMHRVKRPDLNSYSDICIGEAYVTVNGIWQIEIAICSDLHSGGRLLVALTDSAKEAIDVLWDQRNFMNFDYFM